MSRSVDRKLAEQSNWEVFQPLNKEAKQQLRGIPLWRPCWQEQNERSEGDPEPLCKVGVLTFVMTGPIVWDKSVATR